MSASSQRKSNSVWPPRARPALELLENRLVPTFTYHGGDLIQHAAAEAVFLGSYWNTSAGLQEASDLNNFIDFLEKSSYMDMLQEYNVGRGSLQSNGIVDESVQANQTVSDDFIRQVLDHHIQAGNLQAPGGDQLYVVYTPPNVDVTRGQEDSLHNFYGYHDVFTDFAGTKVYYVVVAHPVGNGDFPTLNDFQTLTSVTSHEIAEAITDPADGGWYDENGNEIGDLCADRDDVGFLQGYAVQAQFSQIHNACILPSDTQPGEVVVLPPQTPTSLILSQVAYSFTQSQEFLADRIAADYEQFLGRSAGAGEITFWVTQMRLGATHEQVLAGFAGSAEYYARAGGSDQSWVDALYRDFLGRAADAGGEASWVSAAVSGVSHSQIAYAFARSSERESHVIEGFYSTYLNRTAGEEEISFWVGAFHAGATNEQILAGFVGSDEFFQNQGFAIESWVTAVYETVLGRPADKEGFDFWSHFLEQTL